MFDKTLHDEMGEAEIEWDANEDSNIERMRFTDTNGKTVLLCPNKVQHAEIRKIAIELLQGPDRHGWASGLVADYLGCITFFMLKPPTDERGQLAQRVLGAA